MKKRNSLYPIVHIPMFQIGGGKGAPEYVDPAKFKPMVEPKKINPDEMRFSDWYRAQLKAGKAGDVVTYRGKKILLDPRDFPGYKAPSGQKVTSTTNNPTPSSRSNTPVQSPKPANQVQNTIAVNTPTNKKPSIFDGVPVGVAPDQGSFNSDGTVSFKNKTGWLERQTNMDNAGKTVLQTKRGEGEIPLFQILDAGLTGLERQGAAMARTASGNAQDWTDYVATALGVLPRLARIPFNTKYYPHGLTQIPERAAGAMKNTKLLNAPAKQLSSPTPTGWSTQSGLRSSNYPIYQEGGSFIPMFDESDSMDEDYLYNDFDSEGYMEHGGIHINPANKGKFTASANRARNASKWKHQAGGYIFKQIKS